MKKKTEQSKLAYLKRLVPCEVCGMSSSGRHYGAFSCEGCRNFFKRSLIAHPFYSCRHAPDTVSTNCKLCRFKSCLAAGMSMAAVRVGRPTADERAAVTAYLTQLETQKRLLPQPIMRQRQRRKLIVNASSTSCMPSSVSMATTMKEEKIMIGQPTAAAVINPALMPADDVDSVGGLISEFEQRVVDSACRFITTLGASTVGDSHNNQCFNVLDWQMTQPFIWSILTGTSFDAHLMAAADFTRTLPGFSKVPISDRVSLFARSLFPLVAARCLFSNCALMSVTKSPELIAFNAIFDFFSLERSGTSWQIAKGAIEPLQQLEALFIEIAASLLHYQPTESEVAVIYALMFFNCDSNYYDSDGRVITEAKSVASLEDGGRVQQIASVYAAISDNVTSRCHDLGAATASSTAHHSHNDNRRAYVVDALVRLLMRVAQLIGSIQSAVNVYRCGKNVSANCCFFDEVMFILSQQHQQHQPHALALQQPQHHHHHFSPASTLQHYFINSMNSNSSNNNTATRSDVLLC